jgi:beta-glucanase (GH16 family)
MSAQPGIARRPCARGTLTAVAASLAIAAVLLTAACTGAPSATPAITARAGKTPAVVPQTGTAPPALAPASVPANWKLAFATDFPGTQLDTSTWAECYPSTPAPPGCTNFGNSNEAEWYLPSQVHVGDGMLALVAQRTPTSGSTVNGSPKTYTCRSGMVTTYSSVHVTYGMVQVVARLPFGKGLWPAVWLIPADGSWPPEIDIVEHWGTAAWSRATLHTPDRKQQRGTVTFPDADQGWHTYTLYWTQSRISVYYDSTLALTTTKGVPQQAMYLLLDLADDNTTPGSCSGTMYVKSVKIWEPS